MERASTPLATLHSRLLLLSLSSSSENSTFASRNTSRHHRRYYILSNPEISQQTNHCVRRSYISQWHPNPRLPCPQLDTSHQSTKPLKATTQLGTFLLSMATSSPCTTPRGSFSCRPGVHAVHGASGRARLGVVGRSLVSIYTRA